jgi:predicted MPP superfamily phosphohydrolase
MLVIIFLAVYVALNVYIGYEIYSWLKSVSNVFEKKLPKYFLLTVYILLGLLMIVAFFLPLQSASKKLLSRMINYYEAVFINTIIVIITAKIIGLISKLIKPIPKKFFKQRKVKCISGTICFAAAIILSVYGCVNANHIRTTKYDVTVNKTGDDMKVVLISDLHLGYSLGYKNMEQMAEKINALEPDVVCIAGDIFDNNYDALDDPTKIEAALSSIKSTYGTYACWGNHDISDKLLGGFTVSPNEKKEHDSRMKDLLERSGIKLLEDESVLIDDKFTIIGRLDYEKPGNASATVKSIDEFEFDTSKPVIVIDHEPRELQETADAGIDMDLCGHTHNGQIFPGTLFIKLFWENAAGYLQKTGADGNIMHNIVTEGVGVYGPFMRTGCKSEIVEINVHCNK